MPRTTFNIACLFTLLAMGRPAEAAWHFYDSHNGLSGAAIWQIVEDRDGRIWVADKNQNVLRASLEDWDLVGSLGSLYYPSRPDDSVPYQSLATGRDGATWFVNYDVDPSAAFGYSSRAIGFGHDLDFKYSMSFLSYATALAVWSADTVFVATPGALYQVHNPVPDPFAYAAPFVPTLPTGNCIALHVDRERVVWAASVDGTHAASVFRLVGSRWDQFTENDGLAPVYVVGLVESGNGTLWAVHAGKFVSRFDGGSWHSEPTPFKDAVTNVSAWAADPAAGVWVGAHGCLSHRDADGWRTYGLEEGVPALDVTALCVDHCGQVWVGFADGRIGRFSDDVRGDPRSPSGVEDLFEDRAGTLWASSGSDSLRSYGGETWRARGEGLPDGKGRIFQARSGELWAMTSSGIFRLEQDQWTACCSDTNAPVGEIRDMAEGVAGDLWCTGGSDVWRYDGASWRRFRRGVDFDTTAADPYDAPRAPNPEGAEPPFSHQPGLFVSPDGRVFVDGSDGVSQFQQGAWTDIRVRDGAGPGGACGIYGSPSGDVWVMPCLRGLGVNHYKDGVWHFFSGGIYGIDPIVDGAGAFYCITVGPYGGKDPAIARCDGGGCGYLGTQELPDLAQAFSIGLRHDRLVISTWNSSGFNGPVTPRIRIAGPQGFLIETLPPESAAQRLVFTQRDGRMWFDAGNRLTTLDLDETPPHTQVLAGPAPLTTDTAPTTTVIATRTEPINIAYRFLLDGRIDSGWSDASSWKSPLLDDTTHVLEAWCRDGLGNVDPVAIVLRFDVDSKAPALSLRSPGINEIVHGSVGVLGSLTDRHPHSYLVRLRAAFVDSAGWDTLAAGRTVTSDTLARFDTAIDSHGDPRPDGSYDLELAASDSLGLVSSVTTRFRIDNQAPAATRVSPVAIERGRDGEVFSEDLLAHAYFPTGSFDTTTTVSLGRLASSALGKTDPEFIAWRGDSLRWQPGTLREGKVVILDLSLAGFPGSDRPIVARRVGDRLERLGGTVSGTEISVPVTQPGEYLVGWQKTAPVEASTALSLSLSPRVFRPSSSGNPLAVSFSLPRAALVTIAIYNRAGRRVRMLADRQSFAEGLNVVRWDGLDDGGTVANQGLYLLHADFEGETRVKPFALER